MHWIVKVLLGFHVVAISLWSVPITDKRYAAFTDPNSTPRQRATAPTPSLVTRFQIWNDTTIRRDSFVRKYLLGSGTWQYWDMFAPDPMSMDIWVDAEIEFLDGKKVTYPYPRMSQMSYPLRYVKERYRKFIERGHLEDYSVLWPSIAKRLGKLAKAEYDQPIASVTLVRHFRKLNGPGKPIGPFQTFKFYRYEFTGSEDKP